MPMFPTDAGSAVRGIG